MEFQIDLLTEEVPDLKRFLQDILNQYHQEAYPAMTVPESKQFSLRVVNPQGELVGGAMFWVYWDWLEISLLAFRPDARGKNLGRRTLALIEEKARSEGCTRMKTDSFEGELGFYEKMGFRVIGTLEDYPEGFNYYFLRKDL